MTVDSPFLIAPANFALRRTPNTSNYQSDESPLSPFNDLIGPRVFQNSPTRVLNRVSVARPVGLLLRRGSESSLSPLRGRSPIPQLRVDNGRATSGRVRSRVTRPGPSPRPSPPPPVPYPSAAQVESFDPICIIKH